MRLVDDQRDLWDNPTMSTAKMDSKRRIVLPSGQPGDLFEIQEQGDGRFVVIRLQRPELPEPMSREACLRAMDEAPLRLSMSWDQLREWTREP
jgi:bifunctional DNA-binding transcriptional regulator/antitoxin component of YhaV-PrlF toxin-antitoxin module